MCSLSLSLDPPQIDPLLSERICMSCYCRFCYPFIYIMLDKTLNEAVFFFVCTFIVDINKCKQLPPTNNVFVFV